MITAEFMLILSVKNHKHRDHRTDINRFVLFAIIRLYSSNVSTSGLFKNTPVCNSNCLRVSITSMKNASVIYHFKAEVLSFKAM